MQPDLTLVGALDGEQLMDDLETLARFGATDEPGAHRVAYSVADGQGRDWLEAEMRRFGMHVRRDPIGNTIGIYPGQEVAFQQNPNVFWKSQIERSAFPREHLELPPIALGSHTDTVPSGGKYDGALGVLSPLAIVRALHQRGIKLRHPVEIIDFAAEEASMPGATFGSRAMNGTLTKDILSKPAWDGELVETHLRRAGIDPDGVVTAVRPVGAVAAYLELHIEQGGVLDKQGIPIGIVQGIVGIRRYAVTFHGVANHTGTTPMSDRKDALVAAAAFILFVREVGLQHGIVATVGSAFVSPNAPNVIPDRVDLTVDIRSLDSAILDAAEKELADYVAQAGGTSAGIVRKDAVLSDPLLLDVLREASADLGLPYLDMASGAGHDAMCMATLAPEAMLFVPSVNGISHSPDEYTSPQDCLNGARVLFAALLRLDELLDP